MDIKAKIEEIVKKITTDKTLLSSFNTDPVKTIEKLIGVDLPDDKVKAIVDGVKAKINVDDIGKLLDGNGDGKLDADDAKAVLGNLFGKLKK